MEMPLTGGNLFNISNLIVDFYQNKKRNYQQYLMFEQYFNNLFYCQSTNEYLQTYWQNILKNVINYGMVGLKYFPQLNKWYLYGLIDTKINAVGEIIEAKGILSNTSQFGVGIYQEKDVGKTTVLTNKDTVFIQWGTNALPLYYRIQWWLNQSNMIMNLFIKNVRRDDTKLLVNIGNREPDSEYIHSLIRDLNDPNKTAIIFKDGDISFSKNNQENLLTNPNNVFKEDIRVTQFDLKGRGLEIKEDYEWFWYQLCYQNGIRNMVPHSRSERNIAGDINTNNTWFTVMENDYLHWLKKAGVDINKLWKIDCEIINRVGDIQNIDKNNVYDKVGDKEVIINEI